MEMVGCFEGEKENETVLLSVIVMLRIRVLELFVASKQKIDNSHLFDVNVEFWVFH